MKKVTMKDFRWLGKPRQWEKTYRELSLTVDGMLCIPEGPLLLAVSDEDFTLSLWCTTAPEGGFSGLCIYHTEKSYACVGRSRASLFVESSARHSKTTTTVALPTQEERIHWHLESKGSIVRIGYANPAEEQVVWVTTTTMAGMQGAISFGVFFSNYTKAPFQAAVQGLRYLKSEEQPLVQPPVI